MIRTESFNVSRETFAAERKQVLTDAATDLRPHVKEALSRVGLPSWERPVVDAALDLFDLTARAEVDEWGPVMDDMRDLFAKELGEALAKTKSAANKEHQTDTITGWVAQMSHNAAIEAATTSDPDGNVGLEWVTMGDGAVRDSHQEANGQNVPTGQEFEVGGEKLLYPGQPVGDPSVWISCRCLARPTMLTEASNVSRETLVAAGQGNASDPGLAEDEDPKAAVVVLRPRVEDPVTAIASGVHPHCTLLYLGDGTVDLEPLKAIVESVANSIGHPLTDKVSGRAALGKDQADVLLLDASGSSTVRSALMAEDGVLELLGMQEQFPAWIPHLTIGYPEAPAEAGEMPADITYDLLSIWRGNEIYDYPLGEPMPTETESSLPEKFKAQLLEQYAGTELDDRTQNAPSPAPEPAEAGPAADAAAPAAGGSDLRPWHGVLAPEAAPSGDKRGFAARALTTRDLPLPLKVQFVDDEGHKGSMVVGRIDEVYRDGGLIKASGVWDNTPDADRAYELIEKKMLRGVSVDLDAAEGAVVEAAEGGSKTVELSQGRVCSATVCAIPAFAEAFVRNGTWEDFAGQPLPSGEMVEIPDWPATLVASGFVSPVSADYFRNPMLEEPTPFTLTEDGHIFGHLAEWETCHIGYEVCTTAPPSSTDYGYFLTGQVYTDAGPVPVGQVTLGTGHAPDAFNMRQAMSHYDNTGTAVADITVFEDDHGVAFSGKLRPGVTQEQVHNLLAASLSGDWRRVTVRGMRSMEMVAALAVNVPGFPVPRTRFAVEGTEQLSLTAAGIVHNREKEIATVFSDLREMHAVDVFNEITTLKGK